MTKTQRRIKVDTGATEKRATEPGVKYTCDSCLVDITHTVRIQCAAPECEEVDLCPSCFSEGKEVQSHRAWHDYKVVETHSVPIFTEDWGADEELLLITGLELFGLGNWQEVAEHVGTRFKDECEKHYLETYLSERGQGRECMPRMTAHIKIGREEFQSRKKRRIEDMRKPHALPLHATEQAKGSAPNNHEVAGYMPARLEFEHEEENDAEMVIKDMEFGLVMAYGGGEQPEAPPKAEASDNANHRPPPAVSSKAPSVVAQGPSVVAEDGEETSTPLPAEDERDADDDDVVMAPVVDVKLEEPDPEEVEAEPGEKAEDQAAAPLPMDIEDPEEIELKLALLDIYYSKLNRRTEVKDFLFDRNLMSHKANRLAENKRPKEERDILQRYKVLAKIQTAQDFEVLVDGLIYEHTLRKQIGSLQEYRRAGITTAADALRYEKEKQIRTSAYRPGAGSSPREYMSVADRSLKRGLANEHIGPLPTDGHIAPPSLIQADSFGLLTPEEQVLCSELRILPKPYLIIKETLIRENARRGGLFDRKEASLLFAIEDRKTMRIFDLLTTTGVMFHPPPTETDNDAEEIPPASLDEE